MQLAHAIKFPLNLLARTERTIKDICLPLVDKRAPLCGRKVASPCFSTPFSVRQTFRTCSPSEAKDGSRDRPRPSASRDDKGNARFRNWSSPPISFCSPVSGVCLKGKHRGELDWKKVAKLLAIKITFRACFPWTRGWPTFT